MSTAIRFHFALLIILFFGLSSRAVSQENENPLKPADTSSPQATLNSFLNATNDMYEIAKVIEETKMMKKNSYSVINRVLDCLDLSEYKNDLRVLVGMESAVYLKEILDRVELPSVSELPDRKALKENPEKEEVIYWSIPNTRLKIKKITEGPNKGQYLFSPETVQKAIEYYSSIKQYPYREKGRKVSPGFYELYSGILYWHPALSGMETLSPRGTVTLFCENLKGVFTILQEEPNLGRNNPKLGPLLLKVYSCMNTDSLPEFSREFHTRESAVCIKEILDRVALPTNDLIPGLETIALTQNQDSINSWQIPKTTLKIAKVQEGPRKGEFLFTSDSVLNAPELFDKMKKLPYQDGRRNQTNGLHQWWISSPGNPTVATILNYFPQWVHYRLLGMSVFQWVGLILTMIFSVSMIYFVFRLGKIRARKMIEKSLFRYWITLIFPLFALLVPLFFKHVIVEYLTIRGNALYVLSFGADLVLLFTVLVLVVSSSTRIAESIISLPHIKSQGLDAHLIRIICRVTGLAAAVIVFLEGGRYLGFQLTTLLASAGIGGLAIALSAQGMIKGLFGTVTILLDRPFKVGERILVKGYDGTVEEIGLRSTKIRTLTNHLVSIPNDMMADSEVENIGRRKFIRRSSSVRIPLDTTQEKVEKAVTIIRNTLENHEGMDPDFPPRVYFNEFNQDSFNIKIFYWFTPPDFWEFYRFSEEFNLEIFREFEKEGIPFSLPRRFTYWEDDDEKGSIEVRVDRDS